MNRRDSQDPLEAFLIENMPSMAVPENFMEQIRHRIAAHPPELSAPRRPFAWLATPRWAFATAAACTFVALLAGFEMGESLSTRISQPPLRTEVLPLEQAMLLIHQDRPKP